MVNYWLNNWCTLQNQVPSKPLLLLVGAFLVILPILTLSEDGRVTQFPRQTTE